MQMIDPSHPIYRPLWVRVLLVAICLGWAILEAVTGTPFWALIVGALGVYAAWMLLLNFKPQKPQEAAPAEASGEDGSDGGEKQGD